MHGFRVRRAPIAAAERDDPGARHEERFPASAIDVLRVHAQQLTLVLQSRMVRDLEEGPVLDPDGQEDTRIQRCPLGLDLVVCEIGYASDRSSPD